MTIQDHDFPMSWSSVLLPARPARVAWPDSWIGKAARSRVWRLMGSDLFAFWLGGVLWSALVFVVVHSPG